MGNLAARALDLTVTRGHGSKQQTVIRGLNLQVETGEILAVLGASGAGKTTLLHALAGLLAPSGGEVLHHSAGAGVASGLVFQKPLLLPWLTARENIHLGFRYRRNRKALGLTNAKFAVRVDDLAGVLGISNLLDRRISELSGGQAQRVAIARTIALQPQLLLLDEPFSALDAATRAGLQAWLVELRRMLDLTVVLVTHDIDEAFEVADRVLVLTKPGEEPTEYRISELKIARSLTAGAKTNLQVIRQEILQTLGK